MRAILLEHPGRAEERPLRPVERDAGEPGAGEVAVSVEACGVCRTDLHILEGEVPARLPIVPGHQAAGRVVGVGSGVMRVAVGDRVGVGWIASTCGACAFCRSGQENLCESATFTGRDRDGGFAEILVASADWVFRLPERVAAAEAAPLLCAGIIGYRSLRLSGIRPGGRLGLFGFGASAHLAIQVARHWGCEIFAFSRRRHHRDLALGLGAAWAGETPDDPGVELDAAVTFAPAGEVVPIALRRLRRGATVAVNAIHMTDVPSFPYERLAGERGVRSVTNYTRRDAEELLELSDRAGIRAEIERYPLERASEALLRIKRDEVRGAAVLEIA